MPAPLNNQNAVKDSAEVASATLHIRAIPAEKEQWLRAAHHQNLKLAAWVTKILNAAAARGLK